MCQCWTDPAAFAARKTFFVLVEAVTGRNRIAVVGKAIFDPPSRVYAIFPLETLKTRIPPSPQPAYHSKNNINTKFQTETVSLTAKNFPSGENRTQNTSEVLSLIVTLGMSLNCVSKSPAPFPLNSAIYSIFVFSSTAVNLMCVDTTSSRS
jgi:hypothetical protein